MCMTAVYALGVCVYACVYVYARMYTPASICLRVGGWGYALRMRVCMRYAFMRGDMPQLLNKILIFLQ